jgi:hypothetical protein
MAVAGSILPAMLQSGKKDPVIKKAYEIAYALCRIGDGISNEVFGSVLTEKGVELLCVAVNHENGKIAESVSGLEYVVQLGAGVGYLGQSNVNTLLAEFAELLNAVAGEEIDQDGAPRRTERDIDISDIFLPSIDAPVEEALPDSFGGDSGVDEGDEIGEKWFDKKGIRIVGFEAAPSLVEEKSVEDNSAEDQATEEVVSEDSLNFKKAPAVPLREGTNALNVLSVDPRLREDDSKSVDSSNGGFSASISSDIRQSAILNRIRQSGNCRIRDLQDLFPKWSERTLRYDVEALILKKLVERIGAGSATFYRPSSIAG